VAAALSSMVLLNGCGSSGPPVRDRFYALDPTVALAPSPRSASGTLLITPFGSRGFVGGTQIVFRTADAPLQVQRYDSLLWEQTPGRALAEALIAAVRDADIFAYVVSIADRANPDVVANGDLTRFEHRPTAQPPSVAAAFNLTLITSKDRQTRFSQTYEGVEPTRESTPEAMVQAFNRLTGRLLTDAVRDIQRVAPTITQLPRRGD
jgi:cholesterol transport system auxiliary component